MRITKLPLILLAFSFASCTVHPQGELSERNAATHAGRGYEHPIEQRILPTLSPDATPDELVRYALLTNADVEARYWEWRSAIEQISQEGTQKTNLMITLNNVISNGSTTAAMNSLGIGNDPMNNLVLPNKLKTAATVALNNARAAGWKFDQARLELRSKVLSAYYDYALTAELTRLEEQNIQLLSLNSQMVKLRISTGAGLQQDFLKTNIDLETTKNDLEALHAKATVQLAAINVLLNRDPTIPLTPPTKLPISNDLPQDDLQLLQSAAANNPDLHALAAEVAGKKDAITSAKQQYLPEFGVNVTTDLGGVAQSLVSSVALPILRYQAIDAAIHQAEDNLRAAEAMQHHSHHELAARIISDLAILRDARRQIDLLEKVIIPRTQQFVSASQTSYGANQSSMLDLLDGQRSLIALRRLVAELKVTHEKQLADLEAAIGSRIY